MSITRDGTAHVHSASLGRSPRRTARRRGAAGGQVMADRHPAYVVGEGPSRACGGTGAGLGRLGYLAGRNVLFVNRNAGPQMGRLPELATDLVRSGVDVIVTSTNPATLAAKKATTTIPIVMTVGVEPVAAGLVASLATPGANVTGLTFDVDATQLAAKRLEILKQLLPAVSRVAVLWNPSYGPGTLRFKGTEDAGRKLGITIVSV